MMTTSDKILKSRENRYHIIQEKLLENDVVVSIKVNFPGNDKNNKLAYLIFNSFSLEDLDFKYLSKSLFQSNDGPYYLLTSNEDAKLLKEKTILFEENHPLGRFLDVDVYTKEKQLTRDKKRTCYLCHEQAHICVREKRHSFQELYDYIYQSTIKYYKDELSFIINDSMMKELNLDPKFGLVTKKTSGSHKDMDYDLMVKAQVAMMPYFIEIFLESIDIEDDLEEKIPSFIQIGKTCEKAMYEATKGVNAYKGLIFHMGLMLLSYGYYLSRSIEVSFFDLVKEIAYLIFKVNNDKEQTFGDIAYHKHQILGARGEALSGYIHVQKAVKDYNGLNLMDILVYLIINIEDTNLLKRAGDYGKYVEVKNFFKNLDLSNRESIDQLSNNCIKKGLSFGGSADLLIMTVCMDYMIRKHEKINV